MAKYILEDEGEDSRGNRVILERSRPHGLAEEIHAAIHDTHMLDSWVVTDGYGDWRKFDNEEDARDYFRSLCR
ncbi:hypothetical protein DES53_11880 [Roseimicrobium gellanilyticum]|uniref:Uncharacterized protein n=1 Tax=Roseimicrobium gellanilyticum TaxID=748857 RepID=A0A366H2K0_9BACT|nr:hypothetical protein [Roseimicrobium gellanilyticum]RBP36130.1 hypothetical protein DES53_11880 [Roseimicrobium gellanilyticum]